MNELDDLDLDDLDLNEDSDIDESSDLDDEDAEITDNPTITEDAEIDLDDLDLDDEIEDIPGDTIPDEDVEEINKSSEKIKSNKKPEITIDDDIDIELDEEDEIKTAGVKAEAKPAVVPVVKEKAKAKKATKPAVTIEPEFMPEPVVKEPAKAKKGKAKKPEIKTGVTLEAADDAPVVTMRLDPDFDISVENLDTKSLQVRKTKRSASDIEELRNRIELQGQIEEIKVLKRGDKYLLMAGEGRVQALRQLGRNAKAIVYEHVRDEDILKISTGSNECRLEMSEWDRVNSIGMYFDKDTDVSKDDASDPKSLVSVFGMNKSSIYNYLKLWKFYKDKPAFQTFYTKNRCPLYVLTGIVEILVDYQDKIDSYATVIDIVSRLIKSNDLSRKTFTNYLLKEITDFLLTIKMNKTVIDDEALNAPLDDKNLATAEKKARQEIKSKMKLSEEEQIAKRLDNNQSNVKKKADAEKILESIAKSLDSAIISLSELGEIEDFHKLIHSDKINGTVKKISKINQLVTILV